MKAYPKLKNYISSQINFARENGYVKTILGRKRYLKDINSRNPIVRGASVKKCSKCSLFKVVLQIL